MDIQKRLDHIISLLKERGNRVTPQRIAIIKAIITSEAHPSADLIHKTIIKTSPTTSLATVYKTIKLLKDINEILELDLGEEGSRYDGRRPHPHPHMICNSCGEIRDSEMDDFSSIIDELAKQSGFHVQSHRFDIFGLCASCRK